MSGKVLNITDNDFTATVQSGVTLIDFWAPWCGPCKMIGPILEEIASELGPDQRIAKINVDENAAVAGEFKIMSIPTLLVFKDGKMVNKMVGASTKEKIKALFQSA